MAKPKKCLPLKLTYTYPQCPPSGSFPKDQSPQRGPLPPLPAPLLLGGRIPAWTLHHQRKKTKAACCFVFVLGALIPRRASWPPRPGIALSLHGQPACPARSSELLVFIKILPHAQSRLVCGSWMRWCGGPGARKASGLFSLVFIWPVFAEP